jgi:hypothetical protein
MKRTKACNCGVALVVDTPNEIAVKGAVLASSIPFQGCPTSWMANEWYCENCLPSFDPEVMDYVEDGVLIADIHKCLSGPQQGVPGKGKWLFGITAIPQNVAASGIRMLNSDCHPVLSFIPAFQCAYCGQHYWQHEFPEPKISPREQTEAVEPGESASESSAAKTSLLARFLDGEEV